MKPSTTDRVPEDASNNAVVMTIRNTDISEVKPNLSSGCNRDSFLVLLSYNCFKIFLRCFRTKLV